jgi:hypothetical protein
MNAFLLSTRITVRDVDGSLGTVRTIPAIMSAMGGKVRAGTGACTCTLAARTSSGVAEMRDVSNPMKVGIAAGAAFYLHALIPGSNAWPLLWPAVAGAAAVFLGSDGGSRSAFWESVGRGLKAGAVAGVIFLVATAVSLWLLSTPRLAPVAGQLGAEGPITVTVAVVSGLTLVALLGAALSAFTAGAAYPLAKSKA